jgi:hypothetical protein
MLTFDELPTSALDRLRYYEKEPDETEEMAWERLVKETECVDIVVCDECEGSGYDADREDSPIQCRNCEGDGIVAIADDGRLFNPFEGDMQ